MSESLLKWMEPDKTEPVISPAKPVATGVYNYSYQESSSWSEAFSVSYEIFAVVVQLRYPATRYIVVRASDEFSNDGMSEEERENYEGDESEEVGPELYFSVEDAKQAAELREKTGAWTLTPDEEPDEDAA